MSSREWPEELPNEWPHLWLDQRESTCTNCFDSLGAGSLYDVELLSIYSTKGVSGWAVTWTEWCCDCVTGAARLGQRKIAGCDTYAVDRPNGARPMRVRFS